MKGTLSFHSLGVHELSNKSKEGNYFVTTLSKLIVVVT